MIETDYLVVGAGAAGLAFTDALIAAGDAEVMIVDRRDRPGGHWRDAYPFVRLHSPSANYGVNSQPLGHDALDDDGFYERATGAEVLAYFERVLDDHLVPSDQVRFLGGTEHLGSEGDRHVIRSLATGRRQEVRVRRKLVDARYMEASVPATHTPSFAVDEGARVVPPSVLPDAPDARRYVLLGGGKTAMDACVHLLERGVDPGRIQWVRPRDTWLLDRAGVQPLDQVTTILEGISLDLEAVALATSRDDLFARLEASGRLLRLDPEVDPALYRCAFVDQPELDLLRSVTDVVRRGRVLRVGLRELVLEDGTVPTDPGTLHVDCTAAGLGTPTPRPVFAHDRITLQQVRPCMPCFNPALIGHLEATRDDVDEQNHLCPPSLQPTTAQSWLVNLAIGAQLGARWRADRELSGWIERSRLNIVRGAAAHRGEPRARRAAERTSRHREAAAANLARLLEPPGPAMA